MIKMEVLNIFQGVFSILVGYSHRVIVAIMNNKLLYIT